MEEPITEAIRPKAKQGSSYSRERASGGLIVAAIQSRNRETTMQRLVMTRTIGGLVLVGVGGTVVALPWGYKNNVR